MNDEPNVEGMLAGTTEARRLRHEDPDLHTPDRQASRPDGVPAVLILGSCRGGVFVAAEVLICTDTLGAEEAIRAWLATHEIRVTSSSGAPARSV